MLESVRMFGLFAFLLSAVLYFLPSIAGSKKRNAKAIFFLNLLLGWTIIGWVVALIWAVTVDNTVVPVVAVVPSCQRCQTPFNAGQNFCQGCGDALHAG